VDTGINYPIVTFYDIYGHHAGPMRKLLFYSFQETVSQSTETVEDKYIKEVILGEKQSTNSIGSNIYNPQRDLRNKTGLRMIVIDGSNVAME
jgi:uncharacterized protein YhfF